MSKSIIGIVDTQEKAELIVNDLQRAGFALPDLSVLYPSPAGSQDFAFKHGTKAPEGATAGVSAGGAIGGTLGLLAGLGAIAIPGLGPFIAAGPLLGALSGAAAGAAVGGVTGALVGMGIPEIEAKRYEHTVTQGNILVAVHVNSQEAAREATAVLERDGAHDVVKAGDLTNPAARP
jgi:hypothetical protein